jgi:CheY-like chemotaxis protein
MKTILVVDDEPGVRQLLRVALELQGHAVTTQPSRPRRSSWPQ